MGTATFSQTGTWTPSLAIDGNFGSGIPSGWAIFDGSAATSQTAVWEAAADVSAASLSINLFFNHTEPAFHLLGRFRISATTDDRSLFADGLHTGGDVTASWTVLTPSSVVLPAGLTSTLQGDGSLLIGGGPTPATGTYQLQFAGPFTGVTGFRLEAIEDASLPFQGPGLQPTNGNFVLSEITVDATPVPEPVTLVLCAAGLGLAARRRSLVTRTSPN